MDPKKPILEMFEEDHTYVLTLAPFTIVPKIVFRDTVVGFTAKRLLLIKNPHQEPYHLRLTKRPHPVGKADVDFEDGVINPNEEIRVIISWTPTDVGYSKDTIRFTDHRNTSRSIVINFLCLERQQMDPKKQILEIFEEDHTYVLTLAPFTIVPKIVFRDTVVGCTAKRLLLIKNPHQEPYHLRLTKRPHPVGKADVDFEDGVINPNEEIRVIISWTPTDVGYSKDTIRFTDHRNKSRSIVINFLCLERQQMDPKIPIQEIFKEDHTYVLTLAPFTIVPKIVFRDVPVGCTAKRLLLIKNPHQETYHLRLTKRPHPVGKVDVDFGDGVINPNEEIRVIISWTPTDVGYSKDTISFTDHRNVSRSIVINFLCLERQRKKVKKTVKRTFPKVLANPVKRISKNKSPKSCLKENSPLREVGKNQSLRSPKLSSTFNLERKNLSTPKLKEDKENDPFVKTPTNMNFSSENLTFSEKIKRLTSVSDSGCERRGTYVVRTPSIVIEPRSSCSFDDSLNKENYSSSTPKFGLSPTLKDPVQVIFGEQSSMIQSTNMKELFPSNKANDTYDLTSDSNLNNISTGTYTKDNVSSVTYTKDESRDEDISNLNNYSVDIKVPLPIHDIAKPVSELDISVALKNLKLSSIKEESMSDESFLKCVTGIKRKGDNTSDAVLYISPPKRSFISAPPPRKVKLSKKLTTKEKTYSPRSSTCSPISIISDTFSTSNLLTSSFQSDSSPSTVDPFISSTFYYSEMWLDKLSRDLKKWLNAILAPPSGLASIEVSKTVDVVKLWQECNKKSITRAPTKEKVSLIYHTNNRLNTLRRNAMKLYKDPSITTVLTKVVTCIKEKKIIIREDKNLHLDVGLQSQVMNILLCYNPLWLRIGLETIYDEVIPLESNSDVIGLSTFILLRFFRDPYIMSKSKLPPSHSLYHPNYAVAIKEFTLKQFLILIYFLDQAKSKKLITHDPCLFCKNSPIKESKEMLLCFARELLCAVGDVTKFLRRYNYVVSHKQYYIDEFNFAVREIGVDLRDGVRLVKLVEILLIKDNLLKEVRVPAISRLQKIHNVKLALDCLKENGFLIEGDIESKDVVDGHREKTLSLLWQIIYKISTPLFNSSALVIQNWWRSLKIVIKRRILQRPRIIRIEAAIKIQRSFRAYIAMKKQRQYYLKLKYYVILIQRIYCAKLKASELRQQLFLKYKSAACVIQNRFRALKLMREERSRFLLMRSAAIKIQQKYRGYLLMRQTQCEYVSIKYSACKIQMFYRRYLKMKEERSHFIHVRESVLKIQRWFRAKQERSRFLLMRSAAIKIQQKYRGYLLMRQTQCEYVSIKYSACKIQMFYRRYLKMKEERSHFIHVRESVLKIQRWFRAKQERSRFLLMRSSAIKIQQKYRGYLLMRQTQCEYVSIKYSACKIQMFYRRYLKMKEERSHFIHVRESVLKIQRWFRAKQERSRFLLMRSAAIKIQQKYRGYLLMRQTQCKYVSIKYSACKIQMFYRRYLKMKEERSHFIHVRESVLKIQRWFRAKQERSRFLLMRSSAIKIQQKYRGYLLMRQTQCEYISIKYSAWKIQIFYRRYLKMKEERSHFIHVRESVLKIQRWFRAKQERSRFLLMRSAAIKIQQKYRGYLLMRQTQCEYVSIKYSACKIQMFYRRYLKMKEERSHFIHVRESVLKIQRWFRAKQERSRFLLMKSAAIKIQQKYRGYLLMRQTQCEYVSIKYSACKIQMFYRRYLKMKEERSHFIHVRESVLKIQRWFRAKQERSRFLLMRSAAIKIQQKYRGYLLMRQTQCDYMSIKYSACKIQMFYRRYLHTRVERILFLKKKYSALKIQKWYRSCIKIREAKKEFMEMRANSAAVKIQALWRGYSVRRKECEKMAEVRKRTKQATEDAKRGDTLGERCQLSVGIILVQNVSMCEIIRALKSLDLISRLHPALCISSCDLLTEQLYQFLEITIRSLPDMSASILSLSILLNMVKFGPTSRAVWKPKYLDRLIALLLHWCDKDGDLAPNLCTLLWIFAHDQEKVPVILNVENGTKMLLKAYSLAERKERMLTRVRIPVRTGSVNKRSIPSLKPDWGITNTQFPRTFQNTLFGIKCLFKKLNLSDNVKK